MLSKVQIEHFDMFGYVALPGFFDAADRARPRRPTARRPR